jgi:hypothetical protein
LEAHYDHFVTKTVTDVVDERYNAIFRALSGRKATQCPESVALIYIDVIVLLTFAL